MPIREKWRYMVSPICSIVCAHVSTCSVVVGSDHCFAGCQLLCHEITHLRGLAFLSVSLIVGATTFPDIHKYYMARARVHTHTHTHTLHNAESRCFVHQDLDSGVGYPSTVKAPLMKYELKY